MVLDAERQDQLRRRDEGRGVLEARLPVHADDAERERIVLVDDALRVQSIQDRSVCQPRQPSEGRTVAQCRLRAQRDNDARGRAHERRHFRYGLGIRAPPPRDALLRRGGPEALERQGRRRGLDLCTR